MRKSFGKSWFIFTGGMMLASVVAVRGDATVYWDFDNGFDPSTVVIGPGEVVTWSDVDVYGFDVQVTFSGGFAFHLADYASQAVGFPTSPGVYNYSSNWGNYGSVVVDVPPAVAITVPANNAVFAAPATFTLTATSAQASDVQFFLGTSDSTNFIEDVSAPPFTTGITNLAAGSYALIAVATDAYGMMATNVIQVTVAVTGIHLNAPRFIAGQFQFDLAGLGVGKTNIVQVSTNLVVWTPFVTNLATSAGLTVTNSLKTTARQFYRVMQLP